MARQGRGAVLTAATDTPVSQHRAAAAAKAVTAAVRVRLTRTGGCGTSAEAARLTMLVVRRGGGGIAGRGTRGTTTGEPDERRRDNMPPRSHLVTLENAVQPGAEGHARVSDGAAGAGW